MPLGILQTHGSSEPPGTELLFKDDASGTVADDSIQLKRIQGTHGEIILVPQPSDDPNDPLTWPRLKKEVTYFTIFCNCIIFATSPGPILATSSVALTKVLNVPLTKVSELSGYQLLVVGAMGPLVSVFAQKFGKRPQFLFAAVMGTIGTIICCVAGPNYDTLLAGRIVQGFGVTAWESLSVAAIGDLFYMHERGWRTAGIVLTLACMASVVSIISGPISQNLGWRYLFWIALPFDVVGLLATIFFLPETQFRRDEHREMMPQHHEAKDGSTETRERGEKDIEVSSNEFGTRSTAPKMSYVQGLQPFSGTYAQENIFHLLFEIFIHLLNPAVIWIMLISAVLVSFFAVAAYILAQTYVVPPYLLDIEGIGYFFSGPLVGGVLALVAGPMCDWSAQLLAHRNKGIFEAEFRIPINILGAVFVAVGWFVWQWQVDHPAHNGYLLGSACYGLACLGVSITSTSGGLYILDAFRKHASEIFILQMMVKNFLFYAFSVFENDWAAKKGTGNVFQTFAITSLCLLATCIPMYILGKWNRRVFHSLWERFGI